MEPASNVEWLSVVKASQGATEPSVTGAFHEARNKIEIRTQEVEGFTIDTSKIPIDWDRLVIISINGFNSELKKRDYDVLEFRKDRHNVWRVRDR